MLIDLKILNGNLELKYNEYTYEYTVKVDNSIDRLEIEYKLNDNCFLTIRNNNLNEGENIVYLDVFNKEKQLTYTLYVYKEKSEEVSGIDNYLNSLEVNTRNEVVETCKIQILSISVFLIIVILFSIIFRRKKIKETF